MVEFPRLGQLRADRGGTLRDGLSVIGAAMVPMKNGGYCSVTWPLAVLTANDNEISIRFRSPFVKKLVRLFSSAFRSGVTADEDMTWWVLDRSKISVAKIGRRSVIFNSADGDVRFAVLSHLKMGEITAALQNLGIRQEHVLTTVPSIFGMSTERGSRRK
jgi:hypothetical protein